MQNIPLKKKIITIKKKYAGSRYKIRLNASVFVIENGDISTFRDKYELPNSGVLTNNVYLPLEIYLGQLILKE